MAFIMKHWQEIAIGWVVLSIPASLLTAAIIRTGTKD